VSLRHSGLAHSRRNFAPGAILVLAAGTLPAALLGPAWQNGVGETRLLGLR